MATVIVPLATGCEELEAVTVIDLLRRGGVEVTVAGLDGGPIRCSRGTILVPDCTLDEALAREYDMVVLPGGQPGADTLAADSRLLGLLQRQHAGGRFIAAICAAPRVLAAAGLLTGRTVTSFPGALDEIPVDIVYQEKAVVLDGKLITSRGPGTAIDFALELLALLAGAGTAMQIQEDLQRPPSHVRLLERSR